MKRHQTFLMALSFLVLGGTVSAQDNKNEDDEILKRYCAEDGKFEIEDGKTVFKCKKGTPRFLYEAFTEMLKLDPKTATLETALSSEKWNEYLLQKTSEQLRDPSCVVKDPVKPELECKNTKASQANAIFAETKKTAEVSCKYIFENYKPNSDDNGTISEYVNTKNAPAPSEPSYGIKRIYRPIIGDFKAFDSYFPPIAMKNFGFYVPPRIAIPSPVYTLHPQNKMNLLGIRNPQNFPTLGVGNHVTEKTDVVEDKTTEETIAVIPEPVPAPAPGPETKPEVKTETADCKSELDKAVSGLLEDDKKNIIGLQYELTVLKMASLAAGNNVKTLEALIKKQSQAIASLDDGVIGKMNAVYKVHGLPEDAKKVSEHLKEKAAKANYYAKDKRFFNEDSSAFVLAYQQLNQESGLKDSDVSVLWFMNKVSEKAKASGGQYSSLHNRTNLSTRIAQYTGAIDPKLNPTAEDLDNLKKAQQAKIDDELKGFIAEFKVKNAACYASLFNDATDECNLNLVNATISQLLAVSAQIPSTDLISLDNHLKGGLDGKRFAIAQYVPSVSQRTPAAAPEVVVPTPAPKSAAQSDADLTPVVIKPTANTQEESEHDEDAELD